MSRSSPVELSTNNFQHRDHFDDSENASSSSESSVIHQTPDEQFNKKPLSNAQKEDLNETVNTNVSDELNDSNASDANHPLKLDEKELDNIISNFIDENVYEQVKHFETDLLESNEHEASFNSDDNYVIIEADTKTADSHKDELNSSLVEEKTNESESDALSVSKEKEVVDFEAKEDLNDSSGDIYVEKSLDEEVVKELSAGSLNGSVLEEEEEGVQKHLEYGGKLKTFFSLKFFNFIFFRAK
jgi:hypothetical protein